MIMQLMPVLQQKNMNRTAYDVLCLHNSQLVLIYTWYSLGRFFFPR